MAIKDKVSHASITSITDANLTWRGTRSRFQERSLRVDLPKSLSIFLLHFSRYFRKGDLWQAHMWVTRAPFQKKVTIRWLKSEQSGRVGSSPGRTPPLERHDNGSRTRLGLLYFMRSQRLALKTATSPSPHLQLQAGTAENDFDWGG